MDVIKLKFNLKQITPMIHFQDDDGATIRATELKPKLDRFILSWLAYEKVEKKWTKQKIGSETEMLKQTVENLKDKDWLVDQEHQYPALNYKMRIKAEKKDKDFNKKLFILKEKNNRKVKQYYGNAGYILKEKKNDDKRKVPQISYKASFYCKVTIDITCFNRGLADRIKELLPILIDSTAFGLQQSKGYGNFRVDKIGDKEYKDSIEDNLFKIVNHFKSDNVLVYKLELNKNSNNKNVLDYGAALNAIAEYNRFLKSGLRVEGKYIPSVIMKKYFKQDRYNIINEKKVMKQKLELAGYNINNLKHKDNGKFIDDCDFSESLSSDRIYYTRGLLGFAQSYQFNLCVKKNRNKFSRTPHDKNGKEKENFWKGFDVKGKVGKNEISRFPSPLHYHVTESYKEIYIIVNNNALISLQNVDPEIIFEEIYIDGEKEGKKDQEIKFVAKLPNQSDFKFTDFFEIAKLNPIYSNTNKKEVKYFLTRLGESQNER